MADQPVHSHAEDPACIEVVEIMTDYLEGALPAAEALRLERHLADLPRLHRVPGAVARDRRLAREASPRTPSRPSFATA